MAEEGARGSEGRAPGRGVRPTRSGVVLVRPEPNHAPPEGYRWVATAEDIIGGMAWRVVDQVEGVRHPCRQRKDKSNGERATCRSISVAAIDRGRTPRGGGPRRVAWWHYCADHLYGRWIEDGKVFSWRVEEIT